MAGDNTLIYEAPVIQLVSESTQGPPGPPAEDEMIYAKRVDFDGETVIYRGEAQVGSAETAAVWRIRRITLTPQGDATEEWAGGTASFNKVWVDRTALVFS